MCLAACVALWLKEYKEGGCKMRYVNFFVEKRRFMKKIVSGVMAAAMAVSIVCLPDGVQTVYAEESEEAISAEPEIRNVNLNINGKIAGISDPTPAMTPDAEWSNGTGSYINFGQYNSNVVKYRVLDSDTTDFSVDGTHTILLDCDTVYNKRVFDDDAQNADNGQSKPNDWKYSDIYLYLNSETGIADPYKNYSYGYLSACASKYEAEIITESYNTSHSSWSSYFDDDYSELTGEKIFLLDSREAAHGDYGYYEGSGTAKSREKSAGESWSLRSSVSTSTSQAEYVTANGDVEKKSVTFKSFGVSPALNIDKSTIFFATTDNACDREHFLPTIAESSANTWNLTLFDGNTMFHCERMDSGSVEYGDTIDIRVTSIGDFKWGEWSCPGTDICYDQISALIEDKNGTVVYYGRISDQNTGLSYTGWEEISIPVPETLEDGSYTLKIFAEDVNYDTMSMTHYASNAVDFPIEIYTKEDTDISLGNEMEAISENVEKLRVQGENTGIKK
jgi:type 1 fimbria pilin